jgi:hypothetical protein
VPTPDLLLSAYDDQLRGAEASNLAPSVRAERDGPITRIIGQHRGFISAPPDLQLGRDEADALIARQRDFFAARGEAVEWKLRSHDLPADLPTRLEAAGFVAEARETVVVCVAGDIAVAGPPLPPDVVVRQVTDDADMHRIAAMESEVWDKDLRWLAADLIGRGRLRDHRPAVLVAEVAGQVVSAAWLVFKPGTQFAGLWGGSTLAAWRGRGIYRGLTARRAQLAVARGVRYLQVDASDDSRPILERLGFRPITATTPYVWSPSPGPSAPRSPRHGYGEI